MHISKKQLAILMIDNKVNFTQLADKSGISRQTLSAINNGKSCRPDVAEKIAAALKTTVPKIAED